MREDCSSNGEATVDLSGFDTKRLQVSIHDINVGSGVITLEGMAEGTDEYQGIHHPLIDLSDDDSPHTFKIVARLKSIRATSTETDDEFSLWVSEL